MSLRRPTVACTAFIFCYKPFMWCRPDARLWHYYSAVSSRGVIQTLVWHQDYYSRSFLSRSLSDTRLAPALLFRIFRSRSLSDTRLAPVLLFCSFRSRRHSDPRLAPSILLSLCLIALVNLFICFMFTFVISYVRTVLRVLS